MKKKLEGHFDQQSKLYLSLNAQREIQILNGLQQILECHACYLSI